MKRLIFSAILVFGMAGFALAQTSGNNSSKNSSAIANKHSTKNKKTRKVNSTKSTQQLNNRANYKWKNGQEATPTGHEATATNGDSYVSQKKDSSSPKPGKKQ